MHQYYVCTVCDRAQYSMPTRRIHPYVAAFFLHAELLNSRAHPLPSVTNAADRKNLSTVTD